MASKTRGKDFVPTPYPLIAIEMGLTVAQVKAIERKALRKLRVLIPDKFKELKASLKD